MPSEEQACLVRARSDSENSSGNPKLNNFGTIHGMAYTDGHPASSVANAENGNPNSAANNLMGHDSSLNAIDTNDSGELIDYTDMSVLSQFHEDAIRQAGCGYYQLSLLTVCGLALASVTIEYMSISYIIPSAEIEFCILDNEKSWLTSITLLGMCMGSLVGGNLSDRIGRRRTLGSCLSVNTVFSVIAAFMPTYGPFMMARFCSALGAGGICPTVFAYFSEFCSRRCRPRAVAILTATTTIGALYAVLIAAAIVPSDGQDVVIENKEHFSAWHRYLLLCTLPTIAALVGMIWMHESPRYLMECSREVEALMIYQRVHKRNGRHACCGQKPTVQVNGTSGPGGDGYRLGELELPGKRPPHSPAASVPMGGVPASTVLADMRRNISLFCGAFTGVCVGEKARVAIALFGAAASTAFCFSALAAYVPSTVDQMYRVAYDSNTTTLVNQSRSFAVYNSSLENVIYVNSSFENCTFRDMYFSHVQFINCSFRFVEFSNLTSSQLYFRYCNLEDSKFVDTDVDRQRHMVNCTSKNLQVLSLRGARCPRQPDFETSVAAARAHHAAATAAVALAACAAAVALTVKPALPRGTASFGCLLLCCVVTLTLFFLLSDISMFVFEAVYDFYLVGAVIFLTLATIETYPTYLRCTAHGLVFSVAFLSSIIATCIYSDFSLNGYVAATLVLAVATTLATACSLKVQHSGNNLL